MGWIVVVVSRQDNHLEAPISAAMEPQKQPQDASLPLPRAAKMAPSSGAQPVPAELLHDSGWKQPKSTTAAAAGQPVKTKKAPEPTPAVHDSGWRDVADAKPSSMAAAVAAADAADEDFATVNARQRLRDAQRVHDLSPPADVSSRRGTRIGHTRARAICEVLYWTRECECV